MERKMVGREIKKDRRKEGVKTRNQEIMSSYQHFEPVCHFPRFELTALFDAHQVAVV